MKNARLSFRVVTHLLKNGLDDIFVPPIFSQNIESEIIKDKAVRRKLASCCGQTVDSATLWQVGSSYKFSVPKSSYSYRSVDWIDFEDLVRYTGLVFSIAPVIEARRIPKDERIVFSYRFSEFGHAIDKKINYKAFRERSVELSSNEIYKVKISTDISNFYDRLNLHRLESSLASIGCSKKHVNCINELLFFWADRNSFGLPVGCDASRLLAEAALIPVDRALRREGIVFIRFVDDYRIFAKSFAEAHLHLHILIQELNKESLFINTSKTTFVDLEKSRTETFNEPSTNEFIAEDERKRVEDKTLITIGYTSKIVKNYRFPGKEQIRRYKAEDLGLLKVKTLNAHPDRVEKDIRYFVRCFIYNENRDIDDLICFIDRYVHSLIYVVDALIKEEKRFTSSELQALSEAFCGMYNKNARSPFYDLALLRLLCTGGYKRLEFIRDTFVDLKLSIDPIFLREFILRTMDLADREMLVSFRRLYKLVSLPVRRAIFHVILKSDKMLDGEKLAWLKQVNKSEADPYLKARAGMSLGNKNKR